jgi:hypothetical protein
LRGQHPILVLIVGETPDDQLEQAVDRGVNYPGQGAGAGSGDDQPADNVRHGHHDEGCAHHHCHDVQRSHTGESDTLVYVRTRRRGVTALDA